MDESAGLKVASLALTGLRQLYTIVRRAEDRSGTPVADVVSRLLESDAAGPALQALDATVRERLPAALDYDRFVESPEAKEAGFLATAAVLLDAPTTVHKRLIDHASQLLPPWTSPEDARLVMAALVDCMESIASTDRGAGTQLTQPEQRALADYLTLTFLSAEVQDVQQHANDVLHEADALEGRLRAVLRANDQLLIGGPIGKPRLPIDQIYVSPSLRDVRAASDLASDESAHVRSRGGDRGRFSPHELVSSFRHVVVIGDPGAGKTSLAARIAYDLSSAGDSELIPVTLTLREYGQPETLSMQSIVDYVRGALRSRHSVECPDSAFESLLARGRIYMIFDGLDELLDTNVRADVRGRIESFAHRYPQVRTLVTSRKVGYPEAPLDGRIFRLVHILPFDDDQVEEYATKWFTIRSKERGSSQSETERLVVGFTTESASIRDLRSNPLLLSLLCDLYVDEGYLPTNRPDVYQKCSTLLFERWDRHRDINVRLPIPNALRPALGHLAYEMLLGELSSQASGVTRGVLTSSLHEYLLQFDDDERMAQEAAESFVGFFTNRAWVFTDVGTTPDGEDIFAFTHRTFMEYFAAVELLRRCATVNDLLDFIEPRVARAELDVPAQLAVQMASRDRAGYDEKLFRALSSGGSSAFGTSDDELTQARSNLLEFCCRSSQAILLGAGLLRLLAERVAEEVAKRVRSEWIDYESGDFELMLRQRLSAWDLLIPLINGVNSQEIILQEMSKVFDKWIADGSDSMMYFVCQESTSPIDGNVVFGDEIGDMCDALLEKHLELIRDAARSSPRLSAALAMARHIEVRDVVAAHGFWPLFDGRVIVGMSGPSYRSPPLWMCVRGEASTAMGDFASQLAESLRESSGALFRSDDVTPYSAFLFDIELDTSLDQRLMVDPDVQYCTLVESMVRMELEIEYGAGSVKRRRGLEQIRSLALSHQKIDTESWDTPIGRAFLRRVGLFDGALAAPDFLESEAAETLLSWAERRRHLVAPPR